MDFIADIAQFSIKAVLIVGAILVVAAFLIQMSAGRSRSRPQIEVEKLNTRFRSFRRALQSHLLGKKQLKKIFKDEKKADKAASKKPDSEPGRVFVLDFDGDIRATQVASLREEVTAILSVARSNDEVVVRLESGGGLVTAYGLAAAQLARLRKAKIKLTICVDKVAASGGYMMACVADRILGAPFAVIGSIGVIAQVPNFNRVLKKHDIDYREVTAGEFKRTVTIFGEITEPGLAKFKEQIEVTHQLFKNFITEHRPKVAIETVSTGEHWYGTEALNLGLIDEILTSDEYLAARANDVDLYRIEYHGKRKWMERFTEGASVILDRFLTRFLTNAEKQRYGL